MKKLTILLFSILISFNSYGGFFSDLFSSETTIDGWTKVFTAKAGSTFYVKKAFIDEKGNGYVYYWELLDRLVPSWGAMSTLFYIQGDCAKKRERNFRVISYSGAMGYGTQIENVDNSNPMWAPGGRVLNYVCDYID